MASSNHGGKAAKSVWLDFQHSCAVPLSRFASRAFFFFIVVLVLTFIRIDTSYAGKNTSIVVIANQGVHEKSLTLGAVRSIFGMRLRSWKRDLPIRVFVFNDYNPVHIEFSKKVLGVFPHQLRWSWDRLVYSGTGQAPTYVKSAEEMLESVKNTPGAIGYINRDREHGFVKELPVTND